MITTLISYLSHSQVCGRVQGKRGSSERMHTYGTGAEARDGHHGVHAHMYVFSGGLVLWSAPYPKVLLCIL